MSTNTPLGQEQGWHQPVVGSSWQGNSDSQINPSDQPPLFTSPSDLGRRWHHLRRKCYRQQRNQNFSFTVVSYNVLADGLLHANSDLYAGTEQWLQQWEYRRRNLLKEILHYNADVVCLQEVEDCHYQDWFELKLRERGYSGVYKKRTGDKTDGCATFYKESRFTLVKSKLVSFRKPQVKLMDRDNVAVVVLLKPRTAGRTSRQPNNLVCVSNTHLLFNKKRGDIKLAQLACLFAEIDEIARISTPNQGDHLYHPTICCGDFNSIPFSPIYEFIVRGLLDYNGMHRDNFSGQSYFRHSFPPRQALSSNLIPWELGLTTSCIKRNDSSETVKGLHSPSGEQEANSQQSAFTRNPTSSSELCYPSNNMSELTKSASTESDCRNNELAGNSGCKELQAGNLSLNSMQCRALQDTEFQSVHCSTDPSKNASCTNLNCLGDGEIAHEGEGEQTGSQPTTNKTEKDLYNACTAQRHPFNFFSVYRHYIRNGQPEVTTFHDRACTTVDYMFVAPGLLQYCRRCRSQHGPLQLIGKLDLLSEEDVCKLGGLPNRFLSSDHLSLVSSFLLHV